MRILLKLTLDCTPDAAWRAVRSPAVFQQVSAPIMTFTSLDEGGFSDLWSEGEHRVSARLLGVAPAGEQLIHLREEHRGAVRIIHDTGRGLSWPLTLTTRWHHQMAISAAPDGRTLYRDQLAFSAGALTPAFWLAYWVFWQWRAAAIRRLSSSWR